MPNSTRHTNQNPTSQLGCVEPHNHVFDLAHGVHVYPMRVLIVGTLAPANVWEAPELEDEHIRVRGDAIRWLLAWPCGMLAEAEGLMPDEAVGGEDLNERDDRIEQGTFRAMVHLLGVTPEGVAVGDEKAQWDNAEAVACMRGRLPAGTEFVEGGAAG